jgi:hypothetical protein
MNPCPLCRHYITHEGNSLCTRHLTYIDMTNNNRPILAVNNYPILAVLERNRNVIGLRAHGDICGIEGLHWEAKKMISVKS